MVLSAISKYPSRRTYVIRVSSDARPDALVGRIENLVTGKLLPFASAHELVESIAADLQAGIDQSSGDSAA